MLMEGLLSESCVLSENLSRGTWSWGTQTYQRRCSESVTVSSCSQTLKRGPFLCLRAHTLEYPVLCVLSRFSCVRSCVTPWTVAHQVTLSMEFSRQKLWSGLLCPSPRNLPDPGIELVSLRSPALAGGFFTTSTTWEAPEGSYISQTPKYKLFSAFLSKSLSLCVFLWFGNQLDNGNYRRGSLRLKLIH